jgi:putative FmdB family regulatory protein
MPTYDYQCRQCRRTTEVIHSMLEDGPSTCEHCGGPLRRVLHPAGIIFKGSGFYRTDSRAPSSSGESGGGSKAAPAKSEGGAASGDGATAADTTKVKGTESTSTPSKE